MARHLRSSSQKFSPELTMWLIRGGIIAVCIATAIFARWFTNTHAPATKQVSTPVGVESSVSNTPALPVQPPPPPQAPNLPAPETTEIAPDRASALTLEGLGQEKQDAWFIDQLHEVGVADEKARLFALRSTICEDIRAGASINALAEKLAEEGKTPIQAGTVIASAMVSECPDMSVTALQSDVPSAPAPVPAPAPAPAPEP